MNKKAVAILLISAVGFLIAAVAFYSYGYRNIPGGEVTYYLGSSSMKVFHTYNKAESMLLYIDLAAERSAKKSSSKEEFLIEFDKYLSTFNTEHDYTVQAADFEITYGQEIKGIYTGKLTIKEDNIEYSFSPSFNTQTFKKEH